MRSVLGTLGALAIAGLAVYLGAGWGILVLEGGGALVLGMLFLRGMNEGANDDVDG